MTVVQVSEIQVRTGTSSELQPDTLAVGEFGLMSDTGDLVIGSPSGISPVSGRSGYPYSNIKVITELDIAYTISGNVYYHGPLTQASIPVISTSNHLVTTLFDSSEVNVGVFDYSMISSSTNLMRIGTFLVCTNGSLVSIKDTYQELDNVTTDITFSVAMSGSKVHLLASPTSGSTPDYYNIFILGRIWNSVSPS